MSLKSLLRKITKAAPIIIANAPAVIAALREAKQAMKSPREKPTEDVH